MSLLLDLMQRLRTVPARELPTIPRCVLHVMADHWNAKKGASWPKVETVANEAGCSESAARLALAQLVRAGWLRVLVKATPRDSARFEVRLDGGPVVSRVPRGTPLKRGGVPPESTLSATTEHPGCRVEAPRVPRGTPEALSEPAREPTKEPPITPAGARAGIQQALALGETSSSPASAGELSPAGEAAKGKKARKARDPSAPKAADLYAAAFVDGCTDRRRTVSRPTSSEIAILGKLCRDHAKGRDGAPLVGDALPVWIRAQTVAFLDDLEDPTRHKGGVSAFGLRTWLDNRGKAVRVRALEEPARPVEPEPARAPTGYAAMSLGPDTRTAAQKLESFLRLPIGPGPGRDEVIRRLRAEVQAEASARPAESAA